jgi:nitroreductase
MHDDDLLHLDGHPFRRYRPDRIPPEQGLVQVRAFREELEGRRSVRFFSDAPVPRDLIVEAITAASTAPSGAHKQPWTFVAVSDPELKHRIRLAAEAEERRNYEGRMPEAWRKDLEPLGTDADKGYLEVVPWIVVVFAQRHGVGPEGEHLKHYYVRESVGIACGLFIAALHRAGLATLTHTPSPMKFLGELLGRPSHETAYILFPIGYPSEDCVVPNLARKPLDHVAVWHE